MGRQQHRRQLRFLPYVVVTVALAVVVSLVVTSRGVENRVMDLNNSGVWVTNDSRALWGRANRSAGALDAALVDPNRESGGVNLDVFQDGEAVVAWNMTQLRMFPIDTRDAVAATTTPVGMGLVGAMAMNGGVIASITSDKGEVRTTRYSPMSVPDVAGLGADRPAVATLEVVSGLQAGVDVAVDGAGRVFAASASGQWALIDESGAATYGSVNQSLRSVAVSLVGGIGVITDTVSGDVFCSTGVRTQVGTGVVPQQPGDDGSRVVVASPSGLSTVTLSNGAVSHLYNVPANGSGSSDSATGTRVIAEPVVMGNIVYGAWGGIPGRVVRLDVSGVQESVFPLDGSALVKPTFRVNRGSVVLNDMATGAVFDVDEKWAMDNWEDVAPEATELNGDEEPDSEDSPQARDDHLWVRPGRASVLHVLDNDINPGTGIVAITAVSGPDANRVMIAPDGQTLLVDVAPDQSADMSFSYTITNRAVNSEEADEESGAMVTVSMRTVGENSAPYQESDQGRDQDSPDFTVPSGGALTITPAGWWRDPDSDQVSVISASTGSRVFPVTAQGLIQYSAPASPGQITDRLDYMVSDGYGMAMPGSVYIRVQSSAEIQSVPPVAMSDSIHGVAGEPVVFYPLDNDVPGCDPLDKQAQLRLASPVGARVGLDVSTDLLTGAVTVTAARAGAYFLDYVAGFGSGFSAGKIRVDIGVDDQLVAIPDTAVIRGTVPVVVDVLANDRDRLGSVLTVTSATPRDPDRVRVGIMQGRWLRIELTSSVVSATPTLVDYVVTNGLTQTTGQVSVTQTSLPGVDHVSVVDDIARVRVGDVTTIPVLDNDTSESGETLVVNDNVAGMANAGQLRVEDPTAPIGQETQDVGRAFVDGNRVRYEAPTSGMGKRVRIEYQAGVASGSPMTGYVWVDVVPEPVLSGANVESGQPATMIGNNVPTPQMVEARVVVGDSIRIPVTIYGQDPDGDSVTVAGLRTPPKYGRVVQFGANYLTYESYPDVDNTGMDSFQFYIQDRFGAVGIGIVRIGLSKPGDVPPPLGVDDVVTAQPNVPVTVFPASNDVVAIGTGDTQIVVDDPSTAQVDQESASVVTVAPDVDSPAVSLGYHLDAGGVVGTSAQIMVRSQVGYLNPPNVTDHAAEIGSGLIASVDVLDDAWDVDGPDEAIRIVSVGVAGTFDGSTVSVPVLDRGQVVPFVVEDADGAQAMAVVFVPSLTDGRPTLVQDGLIRMDRNGTRQVDLNDFIESPRHEAVHLTLASQVWTAPNSYLDFTVANDQQVTLRARNDYVGPAALTVEVRDSPDATDPAALTGVVTIPVQIGPATPVLWCPEDVQEIVQGGVSRSFDVAEMCHAWMPTQVEIDALRYTGTWAIGGDGITITGRDRSGLPSDILTLQALPESRPGVDAILVVGIDGYDVTSQLRVRVIAAPRPTISVSSVADVQQGTPVSVPVTVTSPMLGGIQNIVSVTQTSGPAGAVTFDDRTIQVTPDPASHGLLVFDVVGSDISDDTRTDRQVTGNFTVEVFGVPDPPSAPQPGTQLRSGSAVVTFIPGADNGAPILGYELQWEGGSLSCELNTTCEIHGLTNGVAYRFQVRAINKAGASAWSDLGPEVIPNAIPAAVLNFTASNPGCGTLVLTWKPPTGEGTAPTHYHLTWGGADPVTINGTDTTYTPTGLDDTNPSTFTIVAENQAGMGQQPITVTSQSSCKPVWSGSQVEVTSQAMGDTAQITVSWPEAEPQGPKPVTYTVTRTGPDGTKQFAPTTETTLGDASDEITYDGQTYTYHVVATNATGGNDHTSDPITGTILVRESPMEWSTVGGADAVKIEATGEDGRIQVSVVSFPNFRDSSGTVNVTVGSQSTTLTPATPSKPLDGFTNGTDLTASFTACNAESICNTAQSVSLAGGPFGPLTAPTLTAAPGTGRNVCVTASGDGNGRGATLVVTGNNGITEVYRSTTLSVTNLCVDALTWDTTITFTAHLESATTTPPRANSPDATSTTHSVIGTPDDWLPGQVTAEPLMDYATHVNGTGVVLVVNSPPASNGGSRLSITYTVVETGATGIIGQPTTPIDISRTPWMSPTSWGDGMVTGLEAGTTYTFSVVASNGINSNTPILLTATPYGALGAPTITAEPGQGTKACIRATADRSALNGAPARLSISTNSDMSTTGAVFSWQSALSATDIDSGVQCAETGDYNTRMTFYVLLARDPGPIAISYGPPRSIQATSAVETPDALSSTNITWVATGVDGQVRLTLTGTLPAHKGGLGDQLRVDVTGVPGGTVSLTASSPTLTVTGLPSGTPTTLTFTPCNRQVCNDNGTTQKTVTAAGPLGAPVLVSGGPVAEISPDKTVCALFSANANGANAKLTITNNLNSTSISAEGSGTVVPDAPLCVDAGGAERAVSFTATFTDTANLAVTRATTSTPWTGYSAKDAGSMEIRLNQSISAPGGDVLHTTLCLDIEFNPNGGDAIGSIRPANSNPPSDEDWSGAVDTTNFAVPAAGGSIVKRLCAIVPNGRGADFAASLVDASGFGRATQTYEHLSPSPTPDEMVLGELTSTVNGRTVCVAGSATVGFYRASYTISNNLTDETQQATGGATISRELCVEAQYSSQTITFTATVADISGMNRETRTITKEVTSEEDPPPSCTTTVTLATASNPTTVVVTYSNIPAHSQFVVRLTADSPPMCASDGSLGVGCPPISGFTGSGSYSATPPSTAPSPTSDMSAWFMDSDGEEVVTCEIQ